MRKAVLISIQPYYVFLIIARLLGWDIPQEKTVEVRKDFPKDAAWDKVTHIYCSKNRKSFSSIPKQYQPFIEKLLGKVIGEFVCDRIRKIPIDLRTARGLLKDACLSAKELEDYRSYKDAYGWHISDLKIYDKPKELGEFKFPCQRGYNDINNAWCYRERGARLTMCKYNDMKNSCCNAYLTRPPQSWCYVEKL